MIMCEVVACNTDTKISTKQKLEVKKEEEDSTDKDFSLEVDSERLI